MIEEGTLVKGFDVNTGLNLAGYTFLDGDEMYVNAVNENCEFVTLPLDDIGDWRVIH